MSIAKLPLHSLGAFGIGGCGVYNYLNSMRIRPYQPSLAPEASVFSFLFLPFRARNKNLVRQRPAMRRGNFGDFRSLNAISSTMTQSGDTDRVPIMPSISRAIPYTSALQERCMQMHYLSSYRVLILLLPHNHSTASNRSVQHAGCSARRLGCARSERE